MTVRLDTVRADRFSSPNARAHYALVWLQSAIARLLASRCRVTQQSEITTYTQERYGGGVERMIMPDTSGRLRSARL